MYAYAADNDRRAADHQVHIIVYPASWSPTGRPAGWLAGWLHMMVQFPDETALPEQSVSEREPLAKTGQRTAMQPAGSILSHILRNEHGSKCSVSFVFHVLIFSVR